MDAREVDAALESAVQRIIAIKPGPNDARFSTAIIIEELDRANLTIVPIEPTEAKTAAALVERLAGFMALENEDARLPDDVILEMVGRGLVIRCGHSDGDYIELTAKGRAMIQAAQGDSDD